MCKMRSGDLNSVPPSLLPSYLPTREPEPRRMNEPEPPADADGYAEPIAALTATLQALPRLREVQICVPRGRMLAHLPDLGRIEGLERLTIEVRTNDGEPSRADDWDPSDRRSGLFEAPHTRQHLAALHASIARSLANKPRLRKLDLQIPVDPMSAEPLPPAADLLGKPSLAVLPSLHTLGLVGYDWDAPAAGLLTAHYTGLHRLTVSNSVDSDCDELWHALRRAGIALACLRADNKASPALVAYLASYAGLERLAISPVAPLHDDPILGQALVTQLSDALLPHAPTLYGLDLTAPQSPAWSFGRLLAERLSRFHRLRRLWVSAVPTIMVSDLNPFFYLPPSLVLPVSILPAEARSTNRERQLEQLAVIPQVEMVWCNNFFRGSLPHPDASTIATAIASTSGSDNDNNNNSSSSSSSSSNHGATAPPPPSHGSPPSSSSSLPSSRRSPSCLEIIGFYDTLSDRIYLRAPTPAPSEGTVKFVEVRGAGRTHAEVRQLINLHRP